MNRSNVASAKLAFRTLAVPQPSSNCLSALPACAVTSRWDGLGSPGGPVRLALSGERLQEHEAA